MPIVRNDNVTKKAKNVANVSAGIVLGGIIGFFAVDPDIGLLMVMVGIAASTIYPMHVFIK